MRLVDPAGLGDSAGCVPPELPDTGAWGSAGLEGAARERGWRLCPFCRLTKRIFDQMPNFGYARPCSEGKGNKYDKACCHGIESQDGQARQTANCR